MRYRWVECDFAASLRGWISAVLAGLLLTAAGGACHGPAADSFSEKVQTMKSPNGADPDRIADAACALAASPLEADQQRLRQSLGSPEFLLQLNSEMDYARLRSEQLRVARIIKALSANEAPAARATLELLAGSTAFLAEEARQEILLRAAVAMRPAPPAMIRFFDQQSSPDSSNLHLAVDVMAANGSGPAIALLERKLADPDQEPENITGWMRDPILRHRYDVPLLKACERLLSGRQLPAALNVVLLEALFDYRPGEWYPPDSDRPRPPDVRDAGAEARPILKRIADWAQKQPRVSRKLKDRISSELSILSRP